MNIILASKSPQRKRILSQLGIRFQAIASHNNEETGGLKKPHAIAKKIALDKAMATAQKHPNQWVLASDTFVVLSNGSISLKPKNRQEAECTIKLYRNSYCDVYSGLALVNLTLNKKIIDFEKTRLYFKNFTEEELQNYLNSEEWKGRSGSMTIEGKGGRWINKIEGDYWNVVGLPVELLIEKLKEINFPELSKVVDKLNSLQK